MTLRNKKKETNEVRPDGFRFSFKKVALFLLVMWTFYIPEFTVDLDKSYSMTGQLEENKMVRRRKPTRLVNYSPVVQRYKVLLRGEGSNRARIKTEDGKLLNVQLRDGKAYVKKIKKLYSGVSPYGGVTPLLFPNALLKVIQGKPVEFFFAPYEQPYALIKENKDMVVGVKYQGGFLPGKSPKENITKMQEARRSGNYMLVPIGLLWLLGLVYLFED